MTKDEKLQMRISNELKQQALKKAASIGVSLTDVITLFLKAWIAGEIELKI